MGVLPVRSGRQYDAGHDDERGDGVCRRNALAQSEKEDCKAFTEKVEQPNRGKVDEPLGGLKVEAYQAGG